MAPREYKPSGSGWYESWYHRNTSPQHAMSADARGLGGSWATDFHHITPGLLAKHHLPGIPLDARLRISLSFLGVLITSIPGFAGISPAKVKRPGTVATCGEQQEGALVAAGQNGDVIFEKVGWGRWGSRRRGEVSRECRSTRQKNKGFKQAGHKYSKRISNLANTITTEDLF